MAYGRTSALASPHNGISGRRRGALTAGTYRPAGAAGGPDAR
ncbi:hypothetical protein [Streptomyces paromomycinus]|nr:hypothetical protein [Streptomyces paromomycinus]